MQSHRRNLNQQTVAQGADRVAVSSVLSMWGVAFKTHCAAKICPRDASGGFAGGSTS